MDDLDDLALTEPLALAQTLRQIRNDLDDLALTEHLAPRQVRNDSILKRVEAVRTIASVLDYT